MDRSSRFQWGPDDIEILHKFKIIYRYVGEDGATSSEDRLYVCHEKDESAADLTGILDQVI